ncbi:NAD(P)/FAD-dependent oxidoreductase [Aeromicrobium chenweiae]|uniref:Pyridine nucleotide-disulfide oxidoreductase n=1 Tax=Aeromicrobium chenweiae TaxID=2079793 RepID=A0A2S0WPB9_9ACTN|nr:FAD-dependent oxidoreductase [Aeromicrobium chenweiae]AWB93167.1 pyridine nucleotide-disulfide oxidoreductase [Aeromicrobium chenweiae]TGN34157.1 pyridine nucleotide-disulfide oxidoreductase [Aeromicrobium chenweiae]
MNVDNIVVIGGGQAAAVAIRTLRRRGYDGAIVLVCEEPVRPYQRPPLSKEYLTHGDEEGLFLLPEDWTDAQRVEVRTGVRASKISADDRAVLLEDGTILPADRILIATGGTPRRLHDAEGERIVHLRTKADADALRSRLQPGTRLIVVGAGFIGAEIASSARALGAHVTILEAGPAPLQRVLGTRLGQACAQMHHDAGVDLRLDFQVTGLEEDGDEVVVSSPEGRLVADVVVVGIGIVPNVDVAVSSGIAVDNGIVVDEHCRTSMPHVYAAGDVANHFHPLYGEHIRVEHFDNASKQASAAANNMIGRETVYADPHWFWSDQYGANLQFVGHADVDGAEPILRGTPGDETWGAFFLDEHQRLTAAFAVNGAEDIMVARELIAAQVPVDPRVLTDQTAPLMDLLEQM